MNLFLDTHTMLWTMYDPQELSATARTLIGDPSNTLLVSIASLWEITIKIGTGKIVIPGSDIDSILQNLGPLPNPDDTHPRKPSSGAPSFAFASQRPV